MARPKRAPYANEIQNWRKTRGLTQIQLAEMAGVTERTVQRWESRNKEGSPWTSTKPSKMLKAVMDSFDQEASGWYHRHPWDGLYLPDLPGEDLL